MMIAKKYSLYLTSDTARLANVKHPMLMTLERFSSASRQANDPYRRQSYWITPIETIPPGIHTFGGWRFAVVGDGQVQWATKVEELESNA